MKPQASIDNVANYVNGGGRLFVSHLHFYWLQKRPATSPRHGDPHRHAWTRWAHDVVTLTINQTFPKGMALAQWLNTAGRERQPDARAAHGERLRALGQHGQSARRPSGCTCPHPARGALVPVPQLQHARRHARRRCSAGRSCSPTSTSRSPSRRRRHHGRRRLGSEQAVPERLQDQRDVAAGEGARVPVLRPLVVRQPPTTMPPPPSPPPPGTTTAAADHRRAARACRRRHLRRRRPIQDDRGAGGAQVVRPGPAP